MTSESNNRTESVRSAWTRALRNEALRMRRRREVARIAGIGAWIATYADADGTNAYPGSDTLAGVAGASTETIGRAVKVLVATGLLERRRGQGTNARYTLLMPPGPVDWDTHLHLYTDTRQAARRKRLKQEELQRRAVPSPGPSGNGVWRPFPPGSPQTVPAGVPADRSHGEVRGPGDRSRTPLDHGTERFPETVPAGGVHSHLLPTAGDPPQNTDLPGPVAQPQVRAGGDGQGDPGPELQAIEGGGRGRPGGQPPLLLPVPHSAAPDHRLIAARMSALYRINVPVRDAAVTAAAVLNGRQPDDPTAYVLDALAHDPGRYQPALPAAARATGRRAAGT